MTALLPQNDHGQKARQKGLTKARETYLYDHESLPPLTLARELPRAEHFPLDWIFQVSERALLVLSNHIEAAGDPDKKAELKQSHGIFSSLLRTLAMDFKGLVEIVGQVMGAIPGGGHVESLDAYLDMFRTIPVPSIQKDWADDRVFAHMRVGGPNPLMLQRIQALDDRLPLTPAQYARAVPGDTLDAATAEGRLYLVDYAILEGLQNGVFPGDAKWLNAPLALFAAEPGTRALVPVAIQCNQKPGPDNPVFTPDDGTAWSMAKTVVSVADGNHHQTIGHLGRTHLFVEPFVLATHRQLAENHPLSILLRPHLAGTLAINEQAFERLVNPNGPVDVLLAGTIEATHTLTARGLAGYRVDSIMPPLAFEKRGVADVGALPDYPYRDDALLYWNAIRRWVGDYLAIYYHGPADLQADTELTAWVRELIATDGGRVAGMSVETTLASVDRLADAVAVVIFTASVQHAAVNFPQYNLMAYVLNMPLACYTPPPTRKTGPRTADWLAMLPTKRAAGLQMALGYILGTMHYTKLGDYGSGHFADDRAAVPLANFQTELAGIGRLIDERNQSRRDYPFLCVAGIPQSINI